MTVCVGTASFFFFFFHLANYSVSSFCGSVRVCTHEWRKAESLLGFFKCGYVRVSHECVFDQALCGGEACML